MNLTLFGATGALGRECLRQSLEAGHRVRVLVRDPAKLDAALREKVEVVQGDGLDARAVDAALEGSEAALFAIGIDKRSPENLLSLIHI